MTIHTEHPFANPERDPFREFRGRTPAPVGVWTLVSSESSFGQTVSSFALIEGEPHRVWGIVDPDEDFATQLLENQSTFVVNLLAVGQEQVAEVFANLAPSPGGQFTTGSWQQSEWGPVLQKSAGWLGVRYESHTEIGYRLAIVGQIEMINTGSHTPLIHYRGNYVAQPSQPES